MHFFTKSKPIILQIFKNNLKTEIGGYLLIQIATQHWVNKFNIHNNHLITSSISSLFSNYVQRNKWNKILSTIGNMELDGVLIWTLKGIEIFLLDIWISPSLLRKYHEN